MSYSNKNCKNCGYWHGLHHADTMQCPKGGEAPVGKRQEWLTTTFVPDDADERKAIERRIRNLEKRVAELEKQIKQMN